MALKKTAYRGLTYEYRQNSGYDSIRLRVWNPKTQRDEPISARVDADLSVLCEYLKSHSLRGDQAELDDPFRRKLDALIKKYADRHGLSEYKTRIRLEFDTKAFNFTKILDEFIETKKETSAIPHRYQHYLKSIWLPFFAEQGCTHPSQWKNFKSEARNHVKTVKKVHKDEKYDKDTWSAIASVLNGFLRWLHEENYLSNKDDVFEIHVAPTKEQLKRLGESKKRKNRDTYSFVDFYAMKEAIDAVYKADQIQKKRAYVFLLGIGTGLRRGNLIGLKGMNLHPDASVPHIDVEDNIVPGQNRLESGTVTLVGSTKTTVDQIKKLPLIQPDRETLTEIVRFIKTHTKPGERVLDCHPRSVERFWTKIIRDLNFRYKGEFREIGPHGWKHSYATNGAANFVELYNGNLTDFHECCMHEDIRTTMGYVDLKNEVFLNRFKKK